ncbi:LuxR C-terminal-related transcriptional regulator [Citrobacter amalonaticus]|uniref:LuxR C-terminal-related transcriptional regulator n=1 Tax=Citrobacter amalonaticus TaxID=35703 RepID=UPI00300C57D0
MGNISIYGDGSYARIAVEHIIQKIITKITPDVNSSLNIDIFIFEKPWIDVSELHALTCSKAEKTLIIGNSQLLNFLSLKIADRRMSYCEINSTLAELELKLTQFLLKRKTAIRLCDDKKPVESQKKLNWKEFMIISLYISGNSVRQIAGVMQLDYKTVYTYKSLAMRKMGLSDKISLIRHWCHYH